MSQGQFLRTFYLSDQGEVHPIRVQPETVSATLGGEENTPPAGPATNNIRYIVNSGNRKKVPRARGVYFAWVNQRPTGYVGAGGRIPVFSQTVWEGLAEATPGTYLGVPIQVTGKYTELPL